MKMYNVSNQPSSSENPLVLEDVVEVIELLESAGTTNNSVYGLLHDYMQDQQGGDVTVTISVVRES
jgi:phage-related protein